jgi:hypothetical protein
MIPAMTLGAAELGTDSYRIPLVDPYIIYSRDRTFPPSPEDGAFQLGQANPISRSTGLSFSRLVPRVEQVAVQGNLIFGISADGYFILEASRPGEQAQTFASREAWETALGGFGIANPALQTPDALASALPDPVLRPRKYRYLGGRFGISDDMLALIIQLLGFAIAFVVGLAGTSRSALTPAAIVIGLAANVVGGIIIAGGGPGAFVGFVAIPLICIVAAFLGKGIHVALVRNRPARA